MKEKIIDILGGMGPEATRDLFANIIQFTPSKKDQNHLHIIIDNNPKIPDRTAAIIADGEDPVPFMVESGLRLAQSGVDFIVIPCISAHYFIEELRSQLNVPVLSALEEVGKAIKKSGSIIYRWPLGYRRNDQGRAFYRKTCRIRSGNLSAEQRLSTICNESDIYN